MNDNDPERHAGNHLMRLTHEISKKLFDAPIAGQANQQDQEH